MEVTKKWVDRFIVGEWREITKEEADYFKGYYERNPEERCPE